VRGGADGACLRAATTGHESSAFSVGRSGQTDRTDGRIVNPAYSRSNSHPQPIQPTASAQRDRNKRVSFVTHRVQTAWYPSRHGIPHRIPLVLHPQSYRSARRANRPEPQRLDPGHRNAAAPTNQCQHRPCTRGCNGDYVEPGSQPYKRRCIAPPRHEPCKLRYGGVGSHAVGVRARHAAMPRQFITPRHGFRRPGTCGQAHSDEQSDGMARTCARWRG